MTFSLQAGGGKRKKEKEEVKKLRRHGDTHGESWLYGNPRDREWRLKVAYGNRMISRILPIVPLVPSMYARGPVILITRASSLQGQELKPTCLKPAVTYVLF